MTTDAPTPRAASPGEADLGLLRDLTERPSAYDFFQAVRLLERLQPERAAVGTFADPADEAVRFAVRPSTAFAASDIESLEPAGDAEPARMTVNFMGLTGPAGVMPLEFTRLVAERVRARDTALRDFVDIFHHRLISLFYQAWEKYRFPVGYERDQRDRFTRHLLDLIGLGTEGLAGRLPVADEALLFHAGLLSMPSRPAVALEALIEDYFAVPASVEQFVGGWYALDERTQCRLGDDGAARAQLGLGAVVGDEVWDQQSRVRIRIGPLTREQYDRFLPGGESHEPLRALARFFANDQLDVEARLVLARDEIPRVSLGADPALAQPLGWSTWLCSTPRGQDGEETILVL